MNDPGIPGSAAPSPPDPGPRWEFRWGVIVVDDERRKFGGADGFADPRKATRAAKKVCRRNGGRKCEILIDYYNQCGTLVGGDSYSIAYHGALVEDIKRRGMADCSARTGNCQVLYAGCSYPVEKEH